MSSAEGRILLTPEAPLLELGALARGVRERKTAPREVSYVVDSNPNYTNICETDCLFCAFYRRAKDPDAYALTIDQVMEKIGDAAANLSTNPRLGVPSAGVW